MTLATGLCVLFKRRWNRGFWAALVLLLFVPIPARLTAAKRPADDRPVHDDAALAELGIHRYASKRLVLYSDIAPDVARTLPPLIDAAYPEWVKYFGELPPAADGSEFQLTGYLMKDRGLFLDTGLLPEDLIEFDHGRHRGYQFWMAEQAYDYYRRHLLIHEGTHCFMMILPSLNRQPLFYLEGMAELFGTHDLPAEGPPRFRVMPSDPHLSVGFGRIEMIQQAVRQGAGKTLDEALALSGADFARSKAEPYAWSWAVCKFLDTHPRYRERFRDLAAVTDGGEFRRAFARACATDSADLRTEWRLFSGNLEYGYDIERAAIVFSAGRDLPSGEVHELNVESSRGWQSSGIRLAAGHEYQVTAQGEVTLADNPRPWVSQPQGITIQYAGGFPIGRLLGAIHLPGGVGDESSADTWRPIDVGSSATFRAPDGGTLYLRVNDAWSGLGDNQGAYRVTIRAAE